MDGNVLFTRAKLTYINSIQSGRRAETDQGGFSGARLGISNYFVNTLVTALKSVEWELLLSRSAHRFVSS